MNDIYSANKRGYLIAKKSQLQIVVGGLTMMVPMTKYCKGEWTCAYHCNQYHIWVFTCRRCCP